MKCISSVYASTCHQYTVVKQCPEGVFFQQSCCPNDSPKGLKTCMNELPESNYTLYFNKNGNLATEIDSNWS